MKVRHATEEELHLQWLSVDGLVIRSAIRKGTKGGTPLLLLNGIGASLEMMLPFVDAYPEPDILLFDAPGAGKSPAPSRPWRLSDYARVADHVLAVMGVDRVNVMGVSWGGALAQQFARQYPERCKNLILAATTPGQLMVPPSLGVMLRMSNPRRYYDKNYMKRIAGQIYGGKFRTNRLSAEMFADLTNPPSKRGYYFQVMALLGWSSLPWLGKLKMPTIVLHGEDDPIAPLANARIMAHLIPDAKLVCFDCGHLFMLTRAYRTAETIRDFV